MAKMHNKNKGISRSVIPYQRKSPKWSNKNFEQIKTLICNLAKKGLVPSQIGIYLRDSEGIPLTKNITGKKILRILKMNGLNPEIPEDLFFFN